ncbi:MAG: tRNA (adenosine(37)-N6)-dimethylallyltransferase MiaA [Candidatus Omnitrophota bacterium]
MHSKKVVFIVGPTATGKSDIAFELAKDIPLQIVSCDSVQVYKEINIASNKPSAEILKRIPHHLVNIVSLTDRFDVSRFYQRSSAAVESILNSQQLPVVVGGSGLYVKVLLDGIFKGADPDLELREQLRKEAEDYGNEHLHDRLMSMDPQAAKKIHFNDLKKIIRALEVCLVERQPITGKQHQCEGLWGKYDIAIFGLNCRREILYDQINKRVDIMFEAGLIEEVRGIEGVELSPSASGIIGIREVRGYLQDEYSLDAAKDLMKQNTRRFAKRQLTWFRKEKRVNWMDVPPGTPKKDIVNIIREKTGL